MLKKCELSCSNKKLHQLGCKVLTPGPPPSTGTVLIALKHRLLAKCIVPIALEHWSSVKCTIPVALRHRPSF